MTEEAKNIAHPSRDLVAETAYELTAMLLEKSGQKRFRTHRLPLMASFYVYLRRAETERDLDALSAKSKLCIQDFEPQGTENLTAPQIVAKCLSVDQEMTTLKDPPLSLKQKTP